MSCLFENRALLINGSLKYEILSLTQPGKYVEPFL